MTLASTSTRPCHSVQRARSRNAAVRTPHSPLLLVSLCGLFALPFFLLILPQWSLPSPRDAAFPPPPPDPTAGAGDGYFDGTRTGDGGSVREEWLRVVTSFLSTVSPADLRTTALHEAHATGHVSRTCALIEIRGGRIAVNATGLLRKYMQHGRFVSLEAILTAAIGGLDTTTRPRLHRLTALVDVSDGNIPHVATLATARHWRSWMRTLPVPLGNPRGGDDGSATPVLGWDAYVSRHVLDRWRDYPWRSKQGKALFRGALRMQHAVLGSCNGGRLNHCKNASNWTQVNRGVMYNVARSAPWYFDVGFTELLKHKNRTDGQFAGAPPLVKGLPFVDFQRYKLIINVGSNQDWAERLRGLMFMNSAVMHHQAESQEFFTPLLQPWHNIIPIALDMSDMVANTHYALAHEAETRAIRDRQNTFAQRYLSEGAMLEYWRVMLTEYAKRQHDADHPRKR